MKTFILFFLVCGFFPGTMLSQDTVKSEPLLDRLQKIIDLRQTFDARLHPATFSFEKSSGEDAVYTADAAVIYMGFHYRRFGIYPGVEFEYTSTGRDEQRLFKTGLLGSWKIYRNRSGSGVLEPSVLYSKDFLTNIQMISSYIDLHPRFPDFFLPIRDASKVQFKYDGTDNRWVIGLNPLVGMGYEKEIGEVSGDSSKNRLWYARGGGDLTFRRYYFQLNLHTWYESEFEKDRADYFRFEGNMSIFLDSKERVCINGRVERRWKNKNGKTRIRIGFGIFL